VRRRVLVLLRVFILGGLVVGLASATGAAISTGVVSAHDASGTPTALARVDFADVAAPVALSRVRDQLRRDHDAHGDIAAALGIALVLTLSGWWLARERAARALHRRPRTTRRTRAPPMVTATVHR
jgi:uncharacterized membrane protein YccF (DUF307 family)